MDEKYQNEPNRSPIVKHVIFEIEIIRGEHNIRSGTAE